MALETIMMAILTHPVQALLVVVLLGALVNAFLEAELPLPSKDERRDGHPLRNPELASR